VKQTQVYHEQEIEITGDDLTDNEIATEALSYGELIEAALIQLHLPPHVLRMPLGLQAFE